MYVEESIDKSSCATSRQDATPAGPTVLMNREGTDKTRSGLDSDDRLHVMEDRSPFEVRQHYLHFSADPSQAQTKL